MAEPLPVYRGRIDGFRARIARLDGWDTAIVWARTLVFLAAIVVTCSGARSARLIRAGCSRPGACSWGWCRSCPGLRPARSLAGGGSLCEAGIDRIHDRWSGKGDRALFQAAAEAHLYAADLDLFGDGRAVRIAERRAHAHRAARRWRRGCRRRPAAAEARARQGAVAELGRASICGRIWRCVAVKVKEDVRDEALIAWAVRAAGGCPRRGWRAGGWCWRLVGS